MPSVKHRIFLGAEVMADQEAIETRITYWVFSVSKRAPGAEVMADQEAIETQHRDHLLGEVLGDLAQR